MQLWSTVIILIGVLCGLVITFFAIKNLWWLTIILTGAAFNTLVQLLGLWQKKNILKGFNLHIPTRIETEKTIIKQVTEKGEAEGLPSYHNFEGNINDGGEENEYEQTGFR